MAESRALSAENQSTMVVVAMILSLLALVFTFYTFERLKDVATALAEVDIGLHERNTQALQDANDRIQALEKEVAELREAKAAPAE